MYPLGHMVSDTSSSATRRPGPAPAAIDPPPAPPRAPPRAAAARSAQRPRRWHPALAAQPIPAPSAPPLPPRASSPLCVSACPRVRGGG